MSRDVVDGVKVRELGVDDVPALIACIRRCYGESYTEPEFYDAEYLRHELRSRRLVSTGALVGARVVGHVGTRIRGPADAVADTIGGIVDPDYRGAGLIPLMGAQMVARYRDLGIAAAIHFATGAHDRTQHPIVSSGGVATGVLLGHVAARTDYRGIEHGFGDARIGVVVYVQMFGRLDPLDVYVSKSYAERVSDLYEQLTVDRRVSSKNRGAASMRICGGTVEHDAQRGISSFRFGSLAGDATQPASELLSQAIPLCEEVTYADVPVADPRSLELIELLEDNGFFFGALLPGGADREALRLQRLPDAHVAPDAIATVSPPGRSLLEWITQQYSLFNQLVDNDGRRS